MSQHFEGDTKKFTVTAFSSFATVFCVVMLFMNCHGDYNPGGGEHHAAKAGEKHESVKEVKHETDSTHKNNMNHKDSTHINGSHH